MKGSSMVYDVEFCVVCFYPANCKVWNATKKNINTQESKYRTMSDSLDLYFAVANVISKSSSVGGGLKTLDFTQSSI